MPREFTLFWNLCLLRTSPDQIPYSLPLAWLVFALWAAVALPLVLSVPGLEGARVPLFLAATAGVEFVVVAVLLGTRGLGSRLLQTMTALLGADLVLNLLSWPMVLPFAGERTPEAVAAAVGQLLLFGWSIAVKGHILRSALELPRFAAYMLAVAIAFGTMVAVGVLFPDLAAAPRD
ncbi:MAG: hypothetical protein ACOY33_13270 [Pseudomonadota bacterium]